MVPLRFATPDDAPSLAAILEPIVRTTTINFAATAPTAADFAKRIDGARATHPWILAEVASGIIGYAFAREWSPAEGERWSVETGLAIADGYRGLGMGGRLYRAVLRVITAQGYCNAFALVNQPNPASEALHENLGFRRFGVTEGAGFKLGRWHDTSWWQKRIGHVAGPILPPAPEMMTT
jgi:L-amino acid N-acyltransferase YncA